MITNSIKKIKRNLNLISLILVTILSNLALAKNSKRFIIQDTDLASVKAEIEKNNSSKKNKIKYLNHGNAFTVKLNQSLVEKLKNKFPGITIEEDTEVKLLGFEVQKKPNYVTQLSQSIPWGISAVKAIESHQKYRGAGVVVCVVDTGIQRDHPDLMGQIVGGENFVRSGGRINPSKWDDDNGHGTHVAGTIAAIDNSIGVIGVAPSAKLLAMKVLDRRGVGYKSDIIDGMLACVKNGAHVISMSLGGSTSSSLEQLIIKEITKKGIIVVAAAGNESGSVSYPAAYPEVIAVSAVDSQMKFASFSNFGTEIDYAAPGVSVLSTAKGSSYAVFSGTSMATPHVSGIFALMLSAGINSANVLDIGLIATQQGNGFLLAPTP